MLGKWYLSSLGGAVAMLVAIGAMVGACSASGDNSGGVGAGKSSGNGGGGDGGGFIGMGGSNTSPVGGSCAATVNKAEKVPLGMYLMIDRSGSMQGAPWTAVTNALKAFIDQPSTAGIGIGLKYFPIDTGVTCFPTFCQTDADCVPAVCGPCQSPQPGFPKICGGAGGGSCDVADYAKPVVVITTLPGIAPVLKNSLDMTKPSGGTPTLPALDGAVIYMKEWMTANPSAVGVVVLASDGIPEGCNSDLNNVTAIAAAGLGGTPSVKTFVIGVGTQLTALNSIASAGGTGQAFLVDTNGAAQDQFLQAMNAIRGAALSCAYLIPAPPANEVIDYGAINVQYTADDGMAELIPQVSSEAGCPADGKAWYYDNKMPPQQILLCPSTCDKIAADTKGQVDVLVGCKTVIK
jgi:hypothetical protein